MCGKVCAQKTHICAAKMAFPLTRSKNRRMKANFLPVSLFVPVAEAPHVIHIVPPACPMDQLLHGNPFHLHGQAKPVHAKAPLCGPLVRRACGGRLRVRKTGGQRLPFSGVLIRPGCASNTENRHAVSHILAGIMQHAPGSRSNIFTGSAPRSAA